MPQQYWAVHSFEVVGAVIQMHDNKQSASLEQLSRSVLDMEPSEPPDVEIDPPVPITPPVAVVPPLPVAPPLCKSGLEEQAKTKRIGRVSRFIACPFPATGSKPV